MSETTNIVVGDEVTIIDDMYTYTTRGSIGIVKEIQFYHLIIEFTYLSSGMYGLREHDFPINTYRIEKNSVDLYKKYPINEVICRKIREMHNRRIAMGYKF